VSRHWSIFNLELRTPRLVLRVPTERDIDTLADLADQGIHDPSIPPFSSDWASQPGDELRRKFVQRMWQRRAAWSPDLWDLHFAIEHDGVLVGSQRISAYHFAQRRHIVTGSWLGLAHQGQGFGTEARAAVLLLAFDHLHAQSAESSSRRENYASQRVSQRLGYRRDGFDVKIVRGERVDFDRYVMFRPDWEAGARRALDDNYSVNGFGAARDFFALDDSAVAIDLDQMVSANAKRSELTWR
jgi:RimJ/RimL family protein N-acetyltransferase